MKMHQIALAGVAAAFLAGGICAASAQNVDPTTQGNAYHKFKRVKYRPLTVSGKPIPAQTPGAAPGAGVSAALAAPAYAVGSVGGPVGVAGDIAGGTIAGAAGLAFSPLAALGGTAPGISSVPAPPLPIVARYERTGKVASSYDEGYSQDVPVDNSGPIYKLNYKESGERTVTPFSLLAFPIGGLAYGVTAPVRALTP